MTDPIRRDPITKPPDVKPGDVPPLPAVPPPPPAWPPRGDVIVYPPKDDEPRKMIAPLGAPCIGEPGVLLRLINNSKPLDQYIAEVKEKYPVSFRHSERCFTLRGPDDA
jgi:hypothetical protein